MAPLAAGPFRKVSFMKDLDHSVPLVVEASIGPVTDEWTTVGWRDVWVAVKASAERRLGKPLLLMYLVLAIAGALAVAASLLAMRL
jgi:hypothetical protein